MRWMVGAMAQVASATVEHPVGVDQFRDPGIPRGCVVPGPSVERKTSCRGGTGHAARTCGPCRARSATLALGAPSGLGYRRAGMRGSFPRVRCSFPRCGVRVPGEVFASRCDASVRESV